MVNITHQLERLSEERIDPIPFQFHSPRSHPGAALYRSLDDARLVLQIHDELVFEVRERDVQDVATIVQHCMINAVELRVPLQVKLSVGKNWAELEPLELPSIPSNPVVQRLLAEAESGGVGMGGFGVRNAVSEGGGVAGTPVVGPPVVPYVRQVIPTIESRAVEKRVVKKLFNNE